MISVERSASKDQQQPIIALVDQILAAKKANLQADTADLEKQIVQLVYKLYNLTPAEGNVYFLSQIPLRG